MPSAPELEEQDVELIYRPEFENKMVVSAQPAAEGPQDFIGELDFSIPYNKRDAGFNRQREEILRRGVGVYNRHTARFFDALSDVSEEAINSLDNILGYLKSESGKWKQDDKVLSAPAVKRTNEAASGLLALHRETDGLPEDFMADEHTEKPVYAETLIEETNKRLIAEVKEGTSAVHALKQESFGFPVHSIKQEPLEEEATMDDLMGKSSEGELSVHATRQEPSEGPAMSAIKQEPSEGTAMSAIKQEYSERELPMLTIKQEPSEGKLTTHAIKQESSRARLSIHALTQQSSEGQLTKHAVKEESSEGDLSMDDVKEESSEEDLSMDDIKEESSEGDLTTSSYRKEESSEEEISEEE